MRNERLGQCFGDRRKFLEFGDGRDANSAIQRGTASSPGLKVWKFILEVARNCVGLLRHLHPFHTIFTNVKEKEVRIGSLPNIAAAQDCCTGFAVDLASVETRRLRIKVSAASEALRLPLYNILIPLFSTYISNTSQDVSTGDIQFTNRLPSPQSLPLTPPSIITIRKLQFQRIREKTDDRCFQREQGCSGSAAYTGTGAEGFKGVADYEGTFQFAWCDWVYGACIMSLGMDADIFGLCRDRLLSVNSINWIG